MGIIKIDKSKINLKSLIFDSKLRDEQKEIWYEFIKVLAEDNAMIILKTIQEDETALSFLTENLEKKIKAIKTGDKNSWKDIIKREKDYIESK